MHRSVALALLLVISMGIGANAAIPCSECDYVIPLVGGGATYTTVNNAALGLAPGSVICWSGSYNYTSGFTIQNFTGTPENRFVFTNCNGTATINTVASEAGSHGIITRYSSYFRVTGKYQADSDVEYGLRIIRSQMGIAFISGTTYVELDHVEVSGAMGHAGVVAKTDPTSDGGAYQRPGFVMRDVWLHHNYVHHTDTEGFYVGYFDYEDTTAHQIHGLRLYENIVRNTGWDGIQVGCAMRDMKVYNNYVYNYGLENQLYQNSGLFFNPGTKGEVYGNRVDTGTGIGIMYHGNLDTSFYNNVVINAGGGGIHANIVDARSEAGNWTAWHHNTIVGYGNGQKGMVIYVTITPHTPHAKNNVIIGNGTCYDRYNLDSSNVCATSVTSAMSFTNAAEGDFSIQQGSSLQNQGVTCTPNAITTDWNGGARDSQPDQGAFEVGTTPRDDEGDGTDGSDGSDGSDGEDGGDGDGAAATLRSPLAFLW